MYKENRRLLNFLIVVAILVILVINSKNITSPFRTNLEDSSSVPLKALHGTQSVFKRLIPFAGLREESRALRDEINLLNRKIEEMRVIYDENERLKAFINFRKNVPYLTVPAQVIGRDPSNWSNSLIIDKGTNDGVRQGRAVLSSKGLVGRVIEVGRRSAKVLLITDPNSKVGVVIQKNRQGGILVGRPDGKCKMVYLSLDADVAPGDKVVTAGLGGIFPKDTLVGVVVKVEREPGRLYKNAIVKPAEELSRTEEILCIK